MSHWWKLGEPPSSPSSPLLFNCVDSKLPTHIDVNKVSPPPTEILMNFRLWCIGVNACCTKIAC